MYCIKFAREVRATYLLLLSFDIVTSFIWGEKWVIFAKILLASGNGRRKSDYLLTIEVIRKEKSSRYCIGQN